MAPWVISIALSTILQNRITLIGYLKSVRFTGSVVLVGGAYAAVGWYRPETYLKMNGYWWTLIFVTILLRKMSVPLLYFTYRKSISLT